MNSLKPRNGKLVHFYYTRFLFTVAATDMVKGYLWLSIPLYNHNIRRYREI